MLNVLQLRLLTLANVTKATSALVSHVPQLIVQLDQLNPVKDALPINAPNANHDSLVATNFSAHQRRHANAKRDGPEMENSVYQRNQLPDPILTALPMIHPMTHPMIHHNRTIWLK
jgi:hypothetical protein